MQIRSANFDKSFRPRAMLVRSVMIFHIYIPIDLESFNHLEFCEIIYSVKDDTLCLEA